MFTLSKMPFILYILGKRSQKMEYQIGQEVLVLFSWVDEDCWVYGTVLKETDKRIKVRTHIRPDGYYSKHNVKSKN